LKPLSEVAGASHLRRDCNCWCEGKGVSDYGPEGTLDILQLYVRARKLHLFLLCLAVNRDYVSLRHESHHCPRSLICFDQLLASLRYEYVFKTFTCVAGGPGGKKGQETGLIVSQGVMSPEFSSGAPASQGDLPSCQRRLRGGCQLPTHRLGRSVQRGVEGEFQVREGLARLRVTKPPRHFGVPCSFGPVAVKPSCRLSPKTPRALASERSRIAAGCLQRADTPQAPLARPAVAISRACT